jgi:hypothetical protein
MFDFERNIRRWRREMSVRLPLRREAIDELEAHLRDAVAQAVEDGSAMEEAWRRAAARLGSPDALAAEYGKLPLPDAWRWLPARITAAGLTAFVGLLGYALVTRTAAGQGSVLLNLHVFAVTVGYVAMTLVGMVAAWSLLSRAWCGWSQAETLALTATVGTLSAAATALTLSGVALGSLWAREHLGSYWSWDPREVGGAAVLAWGAAATWLPLCRRNERATMLTGVASAVVALGAWFGPLAGNHGPISAILTAVVLAAAALSALAWVPPGKLRFWETA